MATKPETSDDQLLDDTMVERFQGLFPGYSLAHGRFEERQVGDGGKVSGRAITVPRPATPELYRTHLSGAGAGLGVVMLLDDARCQFGAIDYDNRQMDHAAALEKVERLNLPLVLCRSKSGGGHFYVFLSEPVPAYLVRERLSDWAALLGMSAKTEIFPKQSQRFNVNDIGSWINIPYYRHMTTERYAVGPGGARLTLPEFLDLAEMRRLTPEQLQQVGQIAVDQDLFFEGPPCLQVLAGQGGFVEGSRNNGMTAVAVYLRKRYPDDWTRRMDEYNDKLAKIGSQELQELIKSHSKKTYGYQCKQSPIQEVCQRRKCLARKFGVGESYPDSEGLDVGCVTRYDPPDTTTDEPMWRLEVNGRPVMVTNSQLYSRDEFNRACLSQVNTVPIHMPPARWLRFLNDLVKNADAVPLPADATPSGQLWQWIEAFLLHAGRANERDDLFNGAVLFRQDRAFFRSHDLFRYLDNRRVRYQSQQQVWFLLRTRGGENNQWTINGTALAYWSIPFDAARLADTPMAEPTPLDEF